MPENKKTVAKKKATKIRKSPPKKSPLTEKEPTLLKKPVAKEPVAKKPLKKAIKETSVKAPKKIAQALNSKVKKMTDKVKKPIGTHKSDRWICPKCHTNNHITLNKSCKRCGTLN